MNTLGIIFILSGAMLMRQVVTGRVKETPQDVRDVTLALLSGDFSSVQRTLSQRGQNVPPDVSGTVAAGYTGGTSGVGGLLQQGVSDLLPTTVALGSKAKGYRLGATGPDYYDCSSLVWAAMKQLKLYDGPRFTTKSFTTQLRSKIVATTKPVAGDIVLWPGKHMGVVAGDDRMYSAMSPTSGIGYASISGSNASIGGAPVFYHVVGEGGR
jgi:cell wall-associated NlpC family hydrolase